MRNSMENAECSESIIVAENIVKCFGGVAAVDGISLRVNRGEILGFVGPNGAGKTTTIRLLTGALMPDDGEIEIMKMKYKSDSIEIKRRIGVVPDEPPSFRNLRGREFIEFIASIYRCDERTLQRVHELCELMKVDFLPKFMDEYSHGMKQKLMVISVLMRKPEVLFLDEPTTGLDPYSAKALKLLLRRMANDGAAVFITTHILEIAEKMCDRLAIISGGKIVACGTMDELRSQSGTRGNLENIFLQLTGTNEEEIIKIVAEL